MAKDTSSLPSNSKPQHKKLPRLQNNQKISKRPLLHPAISAPRTSSSNPKIVYISPSSPFIAMVKRVRKLLSHIEDRSTGPLPGTTNPQALLRAVEAGISKKESSGKDPRDEEVVMKGTGKAIDMCLRLALYWQGQEDIVVRIRTSSVGAVDDVVEEGCETGESRVRRVSCLEVGVRLK